MAFSRALPDLRARVRIDSSDIDKTEQKARGLDRTLRTTGTATRPLADGLKQLRERGALGDLGADLTRNISVPLAAGAAGALLLNDRFSTTFTQMQGLAGVTAEEVDGLRESVLDLAHDTALAPQTVAEGLYQIRSSGIEGQTALDALDASARAAAVGLGETEAVADAITSAINSYGASNLDAAYAADILVAAVREGKGEADQMAGTLGRVLPIAAELGVGFDQVAGSIAFLSRGNGDAAQSTTQLSGILQKLVRPSRQAQKVLEDIGLSSEELRRVVREDGLLAALQLLDERLGGNSEMLGKVFEDSEGLVGVLGLLRNGGTEAAEVIDAVTDSAGSLDDAFAGLQETDEFKARQALSDLQAAGIEAGAELAPVLARIAGAVGDAARAFADLPQGAQTTIIALGAVAAAAGPAATSIDGLRRGFRFLVPEGGRASAALGNVFGRVASSPAIMAAGAAGIAALTIAFLELSDGAQRAKRNADDLVAGMEATGDSLEHVFSDRLARTIADVEGGFDIGDSANMFRDALDQAGVSADELADALLGTDEQFNAFKESTSAEVDPGLFAIYREDLDALRASGLEAQGQIEDLEQARSELDLEDTGAAAQDTADDFDDLTDAQVEEEQATQDQIDAWTDAQDALNDLTDAVLRAFDGEQAYEEAQRGVIEAIEARAEAEANIDGPHDENRIEAAEALRDAEEAVTEAIEARDEAERDLRGAETEEERERAAEALEDAEDRLADALERRADAEQGVEDARTRDEEASADAVRDLTDAEEELLEAMRRQADLAVELEAAQRAANGEIYTAEQRNRDYREELFLLAGQLAPDDPLRQRLVGLINELAEVEGEHRARVEVDIPREDEERLYGFDNKLRDIERGAIVPIRIVGDDIGVIAGGVGRRRWGGIDEYAKGGIKAHIGRGDLIRYAEPETGGEAYIPRLGDRARSVGILAEVAEKWFGMRVVPMRRGGIVNPTMPDVGLLRRTESSGFDAAELRAAVTAGINKGMEHTASLLAGATQAPIPSGGRNVTIVTQATDPAAIAAAERRQMARAGF